MGVCPDARAYGRTLALIKVGQKISIRGGARVLRIVLDVRQTADGRLAGDLRVPGSRATRPFDGIIELVGLIEVFLASPPPAPEYPAPTPIS